MAHIVIEYSDNLEGLCDIDALVETVHREVADCAFVPLAGLRTRAVARDHFRIADGATSNGFVAVMIRIGPGRTDEQKVTLVDLVTTEVMRPFEAQSTMFIAFSVECQEIDPVVSSK